MQVSAEARWFWRARPAALATWFADPATHGCAPGGVGGDEAGDAPRVDGYLDDPAQPELGVKVRGKKPGVEIKGLVEVRSGLLPRGPFAAPVEIWGKWSSERLAIARGERVPLEKRRLLRKFDTTSGRAVEVPLGRDEDPLGRRKPPKLGCQVELTRLGTPGGGSAWTFGLEAFGPLASLERSLRATVALLEARKPPSLASGVRASYPAWLARRRRKAGRSHRRGIR